MQIQETKSNTGYRIIIAIQDYANGELKQIVEDLLDFRKVCSRKSIPQRFRGKQTAQSHQLGFLVHKQIREEGPATGLPKNKSRF